MFCLAMYEAWQARNLSTEFQESESIFRALVCIFLAYFIGGPVLFLVDDVQVHLFIITALLFITVSFTYHDPFGAIDSNVYIDIDIDSILTLVLYVTHNSFS